MTKSADEMAARLREARISAGFSTPTDAAEALSLPAPTYLGHENGSRGFKGNAARYADFFRVNVEWLLTGRGPMKRNGVNEDREQSTEKAVPEIHTGVTAPDISVFEMPRDVPIYSGAIAGEDGLFEFNGQIVDRARRPPRLTGVKDAYALYVIGTSMFPWRDQGDLVFVHPHMPVKVNDYVVVQLKQQEPGGPIAAYIKRLKRRTAKEVLLEQYNPAETLSIPTSKIGTIHHIMDWPELLGI